MTSTAGGRDLRSALVSSSPRAADMMLGHVDAVIAEVLTDVRSQWRAALAGAVDDILGDDDLPTRLDGVLRSGGKRLRPLMCHWGYECSGEDSPAGRDAAVRVGAALELLHAFALIHDDVMDESDTRRGRPSAHQAATLSHRRAGAQGSSERYGESMAILLGDLAHTAADALVAGLGPRIRRRWFELQIELIAGQREDLSGAATDAGGLARAQRIARIKSGAYTVTRPLQLGAIAGGAGPAVLDVLERFGHELGGVFAARDDILGVWGDPAETGKPSGDDLRQRKPTTLWVDASARLDRRGRALLDRVGTPRERPGDVAALQDAMVSAGVLERSERTIADGVDRAITVLMQSQHLLAPAGVTGLVAMTRSIAWRAS